MTNKEIRQTASEVRRACDHYDQRGCKLYAELTETLKQAGLPAPETGPKSTYNVDFGPVCVSGRVIIL